MPGGVYCSISLLIYICSIIFSIILIFLYSIIKIYSEKKNRSINLSEIITIIRRPMFILLILNIVVFLIYFFFPVRYCSSNEKIFFLRGAPYEKTSFNCVINSDCILGFDSCDCRFICVNKNSFQGYVENGGCDGGCSRDPRDDFEINFGLKSCSCVNNKCEINKR